jgi:hypothetical protein
MSHRENDTIYSKEEREQILSMMRDASARFYRSAMTIGCHPFIEFTGLINEYIKLCQEAHDAGIDFTQSNTHTGQPLPMPEHSARYLGEKLDCIYGPSLRSNPELAKILLGVDS